MPLLPFNYSVFYAIEKAIKVYRRFAQDQINKAGIDLTVNQALLINLLARDPETSQNEMGHLLFKDLAAITRMMEILVKKGYVSRLPNPADRRKNLLKLTDEGERLREQVSEITVRNRAMALQDFTSTEIETLQNLLNKLITNCQINENE